jgi:outer membrane protein, heavy metal efflux system
MSFATAVVLVLAQVGAVLGEANEPNTFLSLGDYLRYAEEHNAGLKSSRQEWIAATEQVPQAKSLPDPQLTYGYYTQQSDMHEKQTVGVMQTFPWFGKIDARTETAAKSAEAAQQKYRGARLALFREVKEGFYEFAYLSRAKAIATENLELLRHFEEVVRTKHLMVEASHPDVIRAQVEIARMEDVLRGLNQLREPTVSRLRTSLTLPAETNLPWPEVEEFNVVEPEYERLVNLLTQKNPELAGLNLEAMAARSRIKLAEKNFYPDVGVGLQWEQMERPGGGSVDKGKDAVLLIFSLNVPLWQDSYKGAQRQAVAEAMSIEQQKINTENSILTKMSQSYYEYNDSSRKIRLYRDVLIPKGKELLQSSETAYRGGTIDFLSLLDAQRMLLDYHLSYERAMADNRQKLAELEMLVGTELDLN